MVPGLSLFLIVPKRVRGGVCIYVYVVVCGVVCGECMGMDGIGMGLVWCVSE